MADEQLPELLRAGPFGGVDATSVGPKVAATGRGISLAGNPNRVSGALTAERGRVFIANIQTGGAGNVVQDIASYVPSYTDENVVGVVMGSTGSVERFMLDVATGVDVALNFGTVPDTTTFNQAVQFQSTLYDNAGHQYSSLNPLKTFQWQYPAPTYTPVVTDNGAGLMEAETASYAFTQTVTDANGAFSQETSPIGNNVQSGGTYPYSATIAANHQVKIAATFSGTNTDSSAYTTNIYRNTTIIPQWYLLSSGVTGSSYIDNAPNLNAITGIPSISGNAQLTPNRDQPPVSATNLMALMIHKERTWTFGIVSNAATNNQPQSQLWYSNPGRPWEFDQVNNVLLVGNSATHGGSPASYSGPYGDYPVALVSLSSVGIAWKAHTTWVIYGDTNGNGSNPFTARQLFSCPGCDSRASVVVGVLAGSSTPVAFWLSDQGPCITEGQSWGFIMGSPGAPDGGIRGFIESLTQADRAAAVGMYSRLTYYLSFPTLNVTWAYFTATNEWYGPLPYSTTSAYSIPANPSQFLGLSGGHNEVVAVRSNTNEIDYWFADSDDMDLGGEQQVTWIGPLTDSGAPHLEKEYNFITLCAPVQPGYFARVTLTVDPGVTDSAGNQKQWTGLFDLSKGPTITATIGQKGALSGFLAQLHITFSTGNGVKS